MKKITIIGAGPAGLTAAYELLKKGEGYEVTLLEQTGRAGGIACTICHNGNYMDLGGHRFYSKCDQATAWWHQIPGVTLLPRSRKSEIYYNGHFFDYPLKANLKNLKALGMKELFLISADYMKAQSAKKEEKSLEDFYINRFGKRLYGLFFKNYTKKVWGVTPDKIAPDWGSQRVKGLNISEVLKDSLSAFLHLKNSDTAQTSLIEAFDYPPYGPGQLWTAVAEEIVKMGGSIRYHCRVEQILTDENKVMGVSYDCKGKKTFLDTDLLISSMPVNNLIAGMENVPIDIRQAASGLVYRDFITVGVLTDVLLFKTQDCWIYMQDQNVRMGRLQIFNNWSKSLVKDPDKTIWLGLEYFCDKDDDLWKKSDKEIEDFAVEELIKTGMIPNKKAVLDTHTERLEKAYPAYFGTYEKMPSIRSFLNSFDNLYCIGRNGQHRYNNMDHSMLTAFECVSNIIKGTKDKNPVWQVNTEKDYH